MRVAWLWHIYLKKKLFGLEPVITYLELYVLGVIAGFTREVDENVALLGYYEASNSNFVSKFWDNLWWDT